MKQLLNGIILYGTQITDTILILMFYFATNTYILCGNTEKIWCILCVPSKNALHIMQIKFMENYFSKANWKTNKNKNFFLIDRSSPCQILPIKQCSVENLQVVFR